MGAMRGAGYLFRRFLSVRIAQQLSHSQRLIIHFEATHISACSVAQVPKIISIIPQSNDLVLGADI